MKFNIDDRVKIVELGANDPSYLLNKVGKIIKIRKNSDYPYEIEFIDEEMKNAEEVLWQEHELEFDKPVIRQFTRVIPESGDWEAWYLNGKLIAQGHHVRVEDMLHALADVMPSTYETIEITDDRAEEGFEADLEDMI